ncbi:MAG: GreA/GreB family elongation factor, partial [Gammaproteobacteria bacterium]
MDLEDEEDGKKVTYTIVGEEEADIREARIAIT